MREVSYHLGRCKLMPKAWEFINPEDRESLRIVLEYLDRLEAAIRKHRDMPGDERCYIDDAELYQVLPEGYTPKPQEVAVTIENCERFIACRQNPVTEYVSPQVRIAELEAENTRLRAVEAWDTAMFKMLSSGNMLDDVDLSERPLTERGT